MQRALCDMAPVFHSKLDKGIKVYYKKLSRKGKIKVEGEGVIVKNYGTYLVVVFITKRYGPVNELIYAKDVYYGRHSLKLVGETQIVKVTSDGQMTDLSIRGTYKNMVLHSRWECIDKDSSYFGHQCTIISINSDPDCNGDGHIELSYDHGVIHYGKVRRFVPGTTHKLIEKETIQ